VSSFLALSRRTRLVTSIAVLATFTAWSSAARADGIDIAWLFTRVGGWKESPLRAAAMLLALIAVNYLLNVLIIVMPAWRSGVAFQRAAFDMLGFTVIAQVADRMGMFAFSVAVYWLARLRVVVAHDLGFWVGAALLANFVTSGILIWFLAKFYCASRWGLPKRRSNLIATVAAVLTNPAWAIGAGLIPGFAAR
jgi:hypothetical protein